MTYAVHLSGNLQAVHRNSEALCKALDLMVASLQQLTSTADLLGKAGPLPAGRPLGGQFLAQPSSWVAVNQFVVFVAHQMRLALRQAEVVHARVLTPLKRVQAVLRDRYQKLMKRSATLEKEKQEHVSRVLRRKQKCDRTFRESEEARQNYENACLSGGKHTPGQVSKMGQRLQGAEKEMKQTEASYCAASEALQHHLLTAYHPTVADLLPAFEAADASLLQAVQQAVAAAAEELGKLHTEASVELDKLTDALQQWDPAADIRSFAQSCTQQPEEVSSSSSSPDGIVQPAVISDLVLNDSSPMNVPLELKHSKTVNQKLVATIRALMRELLGGAVTPRGLEALDRQCDALRDFVERHGELKGLCLKFRLPPESFSVRPAWKDGIVLVAHTADWQAWDSTVFVTEEGLVDQAGKHIVALEDVYPVARQPPQWAPVPAEVQLAFDDFLKTLTFARSPQNSPQWFHRDGAKDADWVVQNAPSDGVATVASSLEVFSDLNVDPECSEPNSRGDTFELVCDDCPLTSPTTAAASVVSSLNPLLDPPSDHLSPAEQPPAVPAHIALLLHTPEGRLAFGRALTGQRVVAVSLDGPSYAVLAATMTLAFDLCCAKDDIRAATILLNMCHTFYRVDDAAQTIYLQAAVKDHDLFRSERFWWDSFMDTLAVEREKQGIAFSRTGLDACVFLWQKYSWRNGD
eukprot:EG_transcript_5272